MKLYKHVRMGEQYPRFYRESYFDYLMNCEVAYPIGLHLMVKLIRWIWYLSYWSPQTRLDKRLDEAYQFGFHDGFRQGHDQGVSDHIQDILMDSRN